MKEKMLRAAREKGRVTHKEAHQTHSRSLSRNPKPEESGGQHSTSLKKTTFNLEFHIRQTKLHKRRKIKFFADKQVLRDYITTRPALQELLKEALHMDGNNQYQPFKHTKSVEILLWNYSKLRVYSFYLLKKLTVLQPQAGPSGGILEEGITIIGDDSSMHVTAAEDLQVGQDVEWKRELHKPIVVIQCDSWYERGKNKVDLPGRERSNPTGCRGRKFAAEEALELPEPEDRNSMALSRRPGENGTCITNFDNLCLKKQRLLMVQKAHLDKCGEGNTDSVLDLMVK
ncbi:LINE-1 retrotransposable element ORF1 protein, partial [Plecturocebus cupreus]